MHAAEFLAPPVVLGVIFFGIYSLIKASQDYKLRKALIAKGADSDLIKSLMAQKQKDPFPNLRFGLILVALGGALGLGEIFGNGQLTAALMLAFAGLAFLAYFVIVRNHQEDNPVAQPDFMKNL